MSYMSLPTDTRGEAGGGGDYFSPQKGQNKVLIVGPAVTGYEYWTTEGKPKRSKEVFADTPDIRMRKNDDGTESPERQKFFWALPVYDYADKKLKVWQINQKNIREALLSLNQNDDWGDPTGKYSISISKSGENLQTSYSVTPNPVKAGDKEIEEAVKMYEENPVDVESALFS